MSADIKFNIIAMLKLNNWQKVEMYRIFHFICAQKVASIQTT